MGKPQAMYVLLLRFHQQKGPPAMARTLRGPRTTQALLQYVL
jgi:hypothetical protein